MMELNVGGSQRSLRAWKVKPGQNPHLESIQGTGYKKRASLHNPTLPKASPQLYPNHKVSCIFCKFGSSRQWNS
jgi:hypothetical protein